MGREPLGQANFARQLAVSGGGGTAMGKVIWNFLIWQLSRNGQHGLPRAAPTKSRVGEFKYGRSAVQWAKLLGA
eukprot:1140532-Pelagomonas_calceolata.AAC.8